LTLGSYDDKVANKLALDDVLNMIELASVRHAKTSLKSLIDRYSVAPYGFIELDVQWLVAMLFKQGKVTFTVNSKNISLVDTDANELIKYLTKREYADKLLIEKRERATDRQIKSVKEVMKDLFSMPVVSEEDDSLIKTFKERAENRAKDIEKLLVEYRLESRYPGQPILTKAKEMLTEILELSNPIEFFHYVDNHKDDLLDMAEDLAPIISFFEGKQKTLFAKAWKYIDIFSTSKTYVVEKELIDLTKNMRFIAEKPAPYSDIYKLPALIDEFVDRHTTLLEKEAEPIRAELKIDRQQVIDILNQKEFADKFKAKFEKEFEELKDKLNHSNEIAAVKNIRHESDALKMRCLNEMADYEKVLTPSSGDKPTPTRKTKNISFRYIITDTTMKLEKERDIDEFLNSIKMRLLKELGDKDDTVINLLI